MDEKNKMELNQYFDLLQENTTNTRDMILNLQKLLKFKLNGRLIFFLLKIFLKNNKILF